MNIIFNHEFGILNEKGEIVGIIEDTFDIERIEVRDDDILVEGTQLWDKKPALLSVGTVFKIIFHHAKFEIPNGGNRSYKEIKDTRELMQGMAFTPEGRDFEAGYRHGITFTEVHSDLDPVLSDRWHLIYRDAEVEYSLPE